MSLDLIIGRTEKPTEVGNGNVVMSVYLGNTAKDGEPENHVRVSVFAKSTNKVVAQIKDGDVVIVKGKVTNKKGKNGLFMELTANATNIAIANTALKPKWQLLLNKCSDIFISGIFVNNSGGYQVSARYDESYPIIVDSNGNPTIEYKQDQRNLRFNVPSSSFAFKQINSAYKAITGVDLEGKQADEQQLVALRKITARVVLGYCHVNAVKTNKEGINGTDYYLQQNAVELHFMRQIGAPSQNSSMANSNQSQSAHNQSKNTQQTSQGNIPGQDAAVPFGNNNQSEVPTDAYAQNNHPYANQGDNSFDEDGFDNAKLADREVVI